MTEFTISRITGKAVALFLGLLGVVCVSPVFVMIVGAFWKDGQPSLAHIVTAFSDPARIVDLLGNSLAVTVGAVAISLFMGTPVGFLCFRTNLPFRRYVVLGCLMAACVPVYITTTCWMALFGMQFWLYSPWGAAWINGFAYTPLVVLITGVCFALADKDLEDVTALDAGKCGVFWHTSLPMGSWGIGAAAVAVAVFSVWDITVTDILMVRTFAEEIFTQFQLGAGPWTASAVSLPMIVILFFLCFVVWGCLRRHGETTTTGSIQHPSIIELGKIRYFLFFIIALCVVTFFLLPVGALIRVVGSFDNLATAWRISERELLETLRVSPIAATICVVLATAIAWMLVRITCCRWVVCVCLLLLIAVPSPIVGIGIIEVLNHKGLSGMIYDSEAVLVMAYVIRALPFGVLALLPAIKRIPNEIEEAVALDGGNWIKKITAVVIPLSWRTIIMAWLLCFIISISEIGSSFLVVPPGKATLSIRFFTLIHYGVYPDAAGICLILLLIVSITATGIAFVFWSTTGKKLV